MQPSGLGLFGDSPALLAWPRSGPDGRWLRMSALHSRLGESPNCLQQMPSYFRDRTLGRRRSVDGMAHTATVDPVVLPGLLRCLLRRRIPGLVRRTSEGITMRRVPHPITAWRRGRTRARRKKWLARCSRRRRGRHRLSRRRGCGCGFVRSLLKPRRRLDAADLINPIMK
jgi:hypothetical protein